uniref:serine/threonine-protein phosphatase 6 regulatory ankyrin repeat subunit C-like n=1 Tax=Ciona intestinalis TaxID=7719 RepID=UPI0002B8EC52|nr:serine/threonine-protein phosphatase 6 regulatory ankyrin repeat subunit C-like [Ciona intestinalis]|eukprot:XP_004225669.1 serine/threonine-protein phosphatase 6 regulatory ankyrin repeat subunit C-like [Ciona intestinalis]
MENSDSIKLISASEIGDYKQVVDLLENLKVDPNSCSDTSGERRSALHRAAAYGHIDTIAALIQAGADIKKQSAAGRLALHEACIGGQPEAVKLLSVMNTDTIDQQDSNLQTPSHLAALHGEEECVKLLLESGCDPCIGDREGKTVAHISCVRDKSNIIKLLFNYGIDFENSDNNGRYPIHVAAANGSLNCIKTLISYDGDVNARDKLGCQPLHYAASHGHLDCLQYLAKQGAKLQSVDDYGRSATHFAAKHGAVKVLHWLLETKIETNNQDSNGETPLHFSVKFAQAQCANCLLQHGASLQIQSKKEEDVIQCARSSGHPNLILDAVENKIRCPLCEKQYQVINWESKHQPNAAKKFLDSAKVGYSLPNLKEMGKPTISFREKNRQKRDRILTEKAKRERKNEFSPRNLAAKFYGLHPKEIESKKPRGY